MRSPWCRRTVMSWSRRNRSTARRTCSAGPGTTRLTTIWLAPSVRVSAPSSGSSAAPRFISVSAWTTASRGSPASSPRRITSCTLSVISPVCSAAWALEVSISAARRKMKSTCWRDSLSEATAPNYSRGALMRKAIRISHS